MIARRSDWLIQLEIGRRGGGVVPLEVVAELGIQTVGHALAPLAGLAVLLRVEEPVGDVELTGVGDDGLDGLDLILSQLTGALPIWGGEVQTVSTWYQRSQTQSKLSAQTQ